MKTIISMRFSRKSPVAEKWRPGRFLCPLLIGLITTLNVMGHAAQAAEPAIANEYQVKAVCLFNFAMFAEWPDSVFAATNSPICIGILGVNPFGKVLEQVVKGEKIKDRKLEIKLFRKGENVKDCQILFISKSEKEQITQTLTGLGTASILTVGETDGFCAGGGMINFFLQENKVKFEINPDAARNVNIKISAQVLSLGKIVRPDAAKENP